MWFQLASPVRGPFCSLVRPCTVNNWQPALCNISAYSTVFATSSNTRTLHVTGMVSDSLNLLTEKINFIKKRNV